MAVNAGCLKLTAHFGERERVHGRLLSDALMDPHGRHRPATSLALDAARRLGFHGDHAPHGDRLLQLRRGIPAVTVIVDAPERIRESFAIVSEPAPERGLVTSETVPVILG